MRHFVLQFGDVKDIIILKDKITGQPRGCAFVSYATKEEAARAISSLDRTLHLPGALCPLEVRYSPRYSDRRPFGMHSATSYSVLRCYEGFYKCQNMKLVLHASNQMQQTMHLPNPSHWLLSTAGSESYPANLAALGN
jgi:RNA recognition motif-containing protein